MRLNILGHSLGSYCSQEAWQLLLTGSLAVGTAERQGSFCQSQSWGLRPPPLRAPGLPPPHSRTGRGGLKRTPEGLNGPRKELSGSTVDVTYGFISCGKSAAAFFIIFH